MIKLIKKLLFQNILIKIMQTINYFLIKFFLIMKIMFLYFYFLSNYQFKIKLIILFSCIKEIIDFY